MGIGGVVLLVGLLLGLVALVLFPFLLAFTLVVVIVRLLLFALWLPFKALGWGISIGLGILGSLMSLGVLALVVALLLFFGLLPLVPIVLIAGLIFWLGRRSAPRSPSASRA